MIVITGFAPFGGEKTNPSWEAVQRLPDEIGGERVMKLRLPVTYGGCFVPLEEWMQAEDLRGVLCVGQAGGRMGITPEAVAINRMHAGAADNEDVVMQHVPVIQDGPAAHFSTFCPQTMVDRLQAAGIPAAVSYHAGTYVCNTLLYQVLQANAQRADGGLQAGFVHVPYAAEQVIESGKLAPSLPLEMIAEGLRLCAATMLCGE